MILPSIGFSFAMELVVRDWKEKNLPYYGVAGFLGYLSSLVLVPIEVSPIPHYPIAIIGILTGIITSWLLKNKFQGSQQKKNHREPDELVNASSAAELSENHLKD
ncbi:MAG: hypothetical protein ACSHX8_15635 [Opitutaceae bacterium]